MAYLYGPRDAHDAGWEDERRSEQTVRRRVKVSAQKVTVFLSSSLAIQVRDMHKLLISELHKVIFRYTVPLTGSDSYIEKTILYHI